jgi:hypothetical protein
MSDLYFTLDGDIAINGNKDIATLSKPVQADVQQIYLRLMTEPGDFFVYPSLGIDLSLLYGMPQTPETGEYGKKLIRAGLLREGIFNGRNIRIDAVPTSLDSIRFDIHILSSIDEPITLSVTQNLGA